MARWPSVLTYNYSYLTKRHVYKNIICTPTHTHTHRVWHEWKCNRVNLIHGCCCCCSPAQVCAHLFTCDFQLLQRGVHLLSRPASSSKQLTQSATPLRRAQITKEQHIYLVLKHDKNHHYVGVLKWRPQMLKSKVINPLKTIYES